MVGLAADCAVGESDCIARTARPPPTPATAARNSANTRLLRRDHGWRGVLAGRGVAGRASTGKIGDGRVDETELDAITVAGAGLGGDGGANVEPWSGRTGFQFGSSITAR